VFHNDAIIETEVLWTQKVRQQILVLPLSKPVERAVTYQVQVEDFLLIDDAAAPPYQYSMIAK